MKKFVCHLKAGETVRFAGRPESEFRVVKSVGERWSGSYRAASRMYHVEFETGPGALLGALAEFEVKESK